MDPGFPHYAARAALYESRHTFSFVCFSYHEMGNLDLKAGASVYPQNRVRQWVRKLQESAERPLGEAVLVWPVCVPSAISTGCSVDAWPPPAKKHTTKLQTKLKPSSSVGLL